MKPSQRPGRTQASSQPAHVKQGPPTYEEQLQCILELSSDYYWEQDQDHRFTLIRHRDMESPDNDPALFLGKTSWELGGTPETGTWNEHEALRARHDPFTELVVRRTDARGVQRYLSISGQPIFEHDGRFRGYRGIAKDVTRDKRQDRLLNLDRTVTRILADAVTFAAALRDAISAICESEGWEAGQFWRLDESKGVMRFHDGWSIANPTIEQYVTEARTMTLERGIGLVGTVWQTGKPLWVADLTQDPRLVRKDITDRTGWRGAFLFPVLSKGRPIGVLDFNAPRIEQPDEHLLQVIYVLGTQIGNLFERSIAVEQLRESEELYASTFELAAIGISHVTPDGRFIRVNWQFCEMLHYTKDELLSLTLKQISHPEDANVTDGDIAKLHAGEIDSFQAEKRYLRKDGTTLWARVTVALKRASDGTPLHHISIVDDISERKLAEQRVRYLATHDEMTALPNRAMFGHLAQHAIEAARRADRQLAILFIDLDRFKIINDSLGHEAGDLFLKEMAARLRNNLRASDVLARLGGDEFVVLAEDFDDPRRVATVARNILSTVMKPVEIMSHECRVTASIGICSYPHDAEDLPSLMKNADMAMYLAKEEGKNNFRFYSKDMRSLSLERLSLETNLRRALEQDEFSLHYQARTSIKSDQITGVEALLRWWSHDLGTVSPARFIPLAEESGLIVPIGKWVLETACAQAVAWRDRGLPPVCLAVNLSPRQFKDSNLLHDIAEVLEKTGLPAELLELEITESMIMHNVERSIGTLNAIKKMGVRLAIDDFGTGYSSLAQLKQFPIDTLKIDRSFIREIPKNTEDKAITEAIIAMGRKLGVTVCAEGVETAEQYKFLSGHACDEMQGYFFNKPGHPDVFAELLRTHVPRSRQLPVAIVHDDGTAPRKGRNPPKPVAARRRTGHAAASAASASKHPPKAKRRPGASD
jgi:diguanylate cyclase (GGDEF)-like protein/PAS domain S-box-containing protein